jgi:hypothetical protein
MALGEIMKSASSTKVVRGLPEEIELDRALYRAAEAELQFARSVVEKNDALRERWSEELDSRIERYEAMYDKMISRTMPLSVQRVDDSLHEQFEKFYGAGKWAMVEAYRRARRAHDNGNNQRVTHWCGVFQSILAYHERLVAAWLRNYPANADPSVPS